MKAFKLLGVVLLLGGILSQCMYSSGTCEPEHDQCR